MTRQTEWECIFWHTWDIVTLYLTNHCEWQRQRERRGAYEWVPWIRFKCSERFRSCLIFRVDAYIHIHIPYTLYTYVWMGASVCESVVLCMKMYANWLLILSQIEGWSTSAPGTAPSPLSPLLSHPISGVTVSVNVNVIWVLPVMSLKLKLLGYYCVVCGSIRAALVLSSVLVFIPTTITAMRCYVCIHVCTICMCVHVYMRWVMWCGLFTVKWNSCAL